MKTHLKKLIFNKTYLIVIIMILFFLPATLSKPAQSQVRAIAVGLGIDWEEEKYKMSAQIVIPTIDVKYNQNVQVISVTAPTILQCIDKMNLVTGKEIGLMHCNFIALGDTIAEKNVTEVVDFFLRSNRMDANTVLLNTSSAYDLLMAGLQLDNGISFSIQDIIEFNKKLIYATDTNIEDFYKNLIEDTQSNYVGIVDVISKPNNSMEVNQESKASMSGGEDSGNSGSSSGGQGSKAISNNGKTALFKGGIKVGELQSSEIKGFNWLRDEGTDGVISVTNLQEAPYYGGGCVMNIEHKITSRNVEVKETIPILKSKIDVLLKMEEVKTTPENENAFNQSSRNYITEEVKQKVKEQILNDVNVTISKCKEYKVDILDVIKQFKRTKPSEFKKLVKFYGSEDAFFQACQFETEVIVRSIL